MCHRHLSSEVRRTGQALHLHHPKATLVRQIHRFVITSNHLNSNKIDEIPLATGATTFGNPSSTSEVAMVTNMRTPRRSDEGNASSNPLVQVQTRRQPRDPVLRCPNIVVRRHRRVGGGIARQLETAGWIKGKERNRYEGGVKALSARRRRTPPGMTASPGTPQRALSKNRISPSTRLLHYPNRARYPAILIPRGCIPQRRGRPRRLPLRVGGHRGRRLCGSYPLIIRSAGAIRTETAPRIL